MELYIVLIEFEKVLSNIRWAASKISLLMPRWSLFTFLNFLKIVPYVIYFLFTGVFQNHCVLLFLHREFFCGVDNFE